MWKMIYNWWVFYGGLGHHPASLVRMERTWRISSPTTSSVGSDAARARRHLGGLPALDVTLRLFLRTFQFRSPSLQIGAVWMIQLKRPLFWMENILSKC